MKLLLVSTSVLPTGQNRYGGIEAVICTLGGALAKAGHEVTIAAPIGSKVPEGVDLIETVKLPEEQDRDDITEARISGNFHVVHDFSHKNVFKENPRAIHMVWDPITFDYDFYKAHINAMCVSEWQRKRYEAFYKRKAIVMDPWLDTDIFKPALNPRRERFLFVGKLSLSKGAHRAIEWAVQNKAPLDVVGGLIPSDSRKYVDEISKYCTGEIKLHFNVTEEEKLDFLQNAIATLYAPIQCESHCLVGMESWACNTPFSANDALTCPLHEIFAPVENLREEAIRRWSLPVALKNWVDLYQRVADGYTWS